jgi:hypothetical protein
MEVNSKFSGCNSEYAGLALVWAWLKREKLLRFLNRIPLHLKTVRRTPKSKLEDLLCCLMSGVESLGQIDKRMRWDPGLTRSVGRSSLADQSLMSQTLDAFDELSLDRLRKNISQLLTDQSRTLSRIGRHQFTVLDLDMTDSPCSSRCEGSQRGRTTGRRGQTVRQLSLVYHHRYRESLDIFLHPGKTASGVPLQTIVQTLEGSYDWDRAARQEICWRLDAGYGSDQKISWLMRRGYRVVAKGYSSLRAARWASSIPAQAWKPVNPDQAVFEHDRVPALTSPHRCLVIRTARAKGPGFRYSYLVTNLKRWVRPKGYVEFYNQRQGIEKEIQQMKSVLGLKHKRKRSFNGMYALALLTMMANLELVWFRRSLRLEHLGMKRFIRDVIKTPGFVTSNRKGVRVQIHQQVPYYQILKEWSPITPLPLFSLESGTILYKN